MSTLVIVESPAKAKTIRKYLGDGYEVTASNGHIRDLPPNQLGIDVEHGYKPRYFNIKGKDKLVKELRELAKQSDHVLLATDPDREGEAISWHLAQILSLDVAEPNRVTFGEITKKGITEGMEHPRPIDLDLFDAQQARRVLDRLVGYKLSPFLWRKVRRGLSAGRVQSVAVRLIVDREREIEAFVPVEYWNIDAYLQSGKKKFMARLTADADGKKLEVHKEEQAKAITDSLKGASYTVKTIKKGKRKRSPAPPFITSTLQQEASRRFGFTGTRTMRAAQTLYEGVDIKGLGTLGLITYMRTDSLRLSDEAVTGAKEFITGTYGEKYVYAKKRVYKRRGAAAAQDAHEAIRPTNPSITPEMAEKTLSGDMAKLYRLIWSRFIASQMSDCLMDTVSVDIAAGDYLFHASGYVVTFDGFTVLYEEATDDREKKETALPELKQGDSLDLQQLKSEQKFTQPPPRYNEATLIRALEENGIGRPSTYAPILTTVVDRGYVEREEKKLKPTPLGLIVNDLLMERFPDIVNVKFSADMETNLDKVEEGKADWVKTVDGFYKAFSKSLAAAESEMEGQKVEVPVEETDVVCEKCGRNMVVKVGRFGKFLACPGFPECRNTKQIIQQMPGKCPRDGGNLLLRTSSKKRIFYGCSNYPECDFMSWDEPTAENCPQCGNTLFRKGGKKGTLRCLKEGCGYTRAVEETTGEKTAEEKGNP
ncbi:type I DNA topoisomerase [Ruminococcaceae bacterium OttesenSCG-928-I18]|nr:type I DNA topoisomerase [Ruminococcaceae bacterium OttesenSCG-928-I18]